jgi:hypothetical protein
MGIQADGFRPTLHAARPVDGKEREQASTLVPLSDFSHRKNEAIECRYLQGRYGAVPITRHYQIERLHEPHA